MDDPKSLLERAFGMARARGKPDWRRMTTAVLKNRLLALTQHRFRESDYEATSMIEFVRKFPDLLRIDDGRSPPMIEILKDVDAAYEPGEKASVSGRIRPDLWDAIMDFTAQRPYMWDEASKTAVRRDDPSQGGKVLPTITADEETLWRGAFAELHKDELEAESDRLALKEWSERRLGTFKLPLPLRRTWNDFLKAQVVNRLDEWFRTSEVGRPPSLFEERPPHERGGAGMREFVMRCIAEMTDVELQEVALPARVMMRVLGKQGR